MPNISCVLLFPHGADLLRSLQEVIRSSVPPNIKCGSVSRSWKQHRSFGNVFIQHLHPHATHKGVGIQPASTHTRVPDAMRFTPHTHCHTLPFHTTRCGGMWNAWKTRQSFWCRAFLCTKAGLKGLRTSSAWTEVWIVWKPILEVLKMKPLIMRYTSNEESHRNKVLILRIMGGGLWDKIQLWKKLNWN